MIIAATPKAKIIEIGKFNVNLFNSELIHSFLKILPKIGKGLQKATRDYRTEVRNPAEERKGASPEFWNDIY